MPGNIDFTCFGVHYISNEILATIKEDGDDPLTFFQNDLFLLAEDTMKEGEFTWSTTSGLSHSNTYAFAKLELEIKCCFFTSGL